MLIYVDGDTTQYHSPTLGFTPQPFREGEDLLSVNKSVYLQMASNERKAEAAFNRIIEVDGNCYLVKEETILQLQRIAAGSVDAAFKTASKNRESSTVFLTPAQAGVAAQAISDKIQSWFNKEASMKAAMNSFTTVEEFWSYDVSLEWSKL